MSVELVSAVLALRGVSPHEKLLLVALAEDARRGSRQASPGMDDDRAGRPGLLTRTALRRSTVYAVTAGLLATDRPGGPLLRQVSRGHGTGRAGGARRAVFELLLPEQSASATPDPDPVESASATPDPDPSQPPAMAESASWEPDPSRKYLSEKPLSPGKETSTPMHTTTGETTADDGDTFGARAFAALGRADLTAAQLDQVHRAAEHRLGIALAADAAYAVAAIPGVRNLAAYVKALPDDDWRTLAEQRREKRDHADRPRRKAARSRYLCEHDHPNGRRLTADGTSPCEACDRSAAQPVAVGQ